MVGLLDATLPEKLQLDPDLTLEKAIAKVRNAETVKSQQAEDAIPQLTETRTKDSKGGKKNLIVGSRLEAHHQNVIDVARHLHMNGIHMQEMW